MVDQENGEKKGGGYRLRHWQDHLHSITSPDKMLAFHHTVDRITSKFQLAVSKREQRFTRLPH